MKKNFSLFVAIFCILGFKTYAQTYPPDANSFDNGTMPVQANPGYKESITDSTFGTTITRVTDKAAFGSTSNVNGHEYSSMEAWNCNGTMLIFKIGGYPEVIIDGNTFNILGKYGTPQGSTWSNTQAFVMYGISGNKYVKYDVSTKKTTVVKTFSDYSSLVYSGVEHLSIDDKYTALMGYKGDTLYLITFNLASNTIIAEKKLGKLATGDADLNGVNGIFISSKGNYVVVVFKSSGSGPTQGTNVYDQNLNFIRHLGDQSGHNDMGMDANGDEIIVGQYATSGRAMVSRRLSDDKTIVVLSESNSSYAQHISCRNFKRPGWCYMSEYAATYDQNRPMTNKLFALKLDGSQTIEFFGWSRRSNTEAYERSQFICPNPDGTKVVFRTDWGNGASDAMINEYVATALIATPDALAPSVPTELVATSIDRTSCTLSWTAATDNVAVTNYELFIGGVSAGKTNLTSYDVSGLICDADNSLTVKATDAAGNWSEASTAKIVTTLVCDTEKPSAPANIVASEIGSTSCIITWTAATDNVMVTGYSIYNDGVLVGQTSELTFTISSFNCGTTNSVTVVARDANNNESLPSIPISITTSACKVNIALNKSVTFSTDQAADGNAGAMATDGNITTRWAASSGASNEWIIVDLGKNYNISGAEIMWEVPGWIYKYKIESSTDNKKWTLELDKTNNTNSGQIETVSFYAYSKRYIRLTNTGWGNGGFWTSLFEFRIFENNDQDSVPPSVPTELAVTETTISKTSFKVSWTASTDNLEVEDYEVFVDSVSVGTINTTSKYITNLTCGKAYAITVRARDVSGNWSDQCIALNVHTKDCENVSIEEKAVKEGIFVYPNPANTNITIANIKAEAKISIYTIDGKLIKSIDKLNTNEVNLPINDWNQGVYLLKIQFGNSLIVKKIIVE